MNINQLRRELEVDEGRVDKIYLDHLGLPTFGIGHLVTKKDPEYKMPVDTPVSDTRVVECFNNDVLTVVSDCNKLYKNFDELPDEVQLIIANMMFNMGRPRLSKFKGMKAGILASDWKVAADEMIDSRWYKQVPNRAGRLVKRMRAVTN
jgi:lysozyme